ncbi:MAG: dockerin type I domain-containing protein, partial [Planctomycetota bacterium]
VNPVNDNAPLFTSSSNAVIPENTTLVQSLSATDNDLPGDTVSFSIVGGPDASEFQIVGGDQLEFIGAPDFENPTDSNGNNIYVVEVRANDNAGLTTNLTMSVRVTDVDELSCDFDDDGDCDGADIDALQANIVTGPADPGTFDLTGDGNVTIADRNEWLAQAGAENLPSGGAYLLGDANLDGVVDISDFNIWNANKFFATSAWTAADFNSDGSVDVSDFNIWNTNKFQSSDAALRTWGNQFTMNSTQQPSRHRADDDALVDLIFADEVLEHELPQPGADGSPITGFPLVTLRR